MLLKRHILPPPPPPMKICTYPVTQIMYTETENVLCNSTNSQHKMNPSTRVQTPHTVQTDRGEAANPLHTEKQLGGLSFHLTNTAAPFAFLVFLVGINLVLEHGVEDVEHQLGHGGLGMRRLLLLLLVSPHRLLDGAPEQGKRSVSCARQPQGAHSHYSMNHKRCKNEKTTNGLCMPRR